MDPQQQPRWQLTRRQLLWSGTAVGLVLLTISVVIGYRYGITLWDWIKLLIVPAVIAGGGLWFNTQQRAREQQIANDRAQDEALQAYLDQMSQLLTDQDRPLHRARPGDRLSTVARARTLTVLARLDGERKGSVVQFLYESGLIDKNRVVLTLSGADLRRANLSGTDLHEAHLSEVHMSEANLTEANLRKADLREADLREAHMTKAKLNGVNMRGADLTDAHMSGAALDLADLFGATLSGTNLSGAFLGETNLSGAFLGMADLSEADLRGADLSKADLFYANLSRANLSSAKPDRPGLILKRVAETARMIRDLKEGRGREANPSDVYVTNLSGADLTDAHMSGADMSGVRGVTNKELEQQAKTLKGATMPNGQKYEDWLKDREGSKEGE